MRFCLCRWWQRHRRLSVWLFLASPVLADLGEAPAALPAPRLA
jgi:hypothetical protein